MDQRRIILANDDLRLELSPTGATLLKLEVKDRNGQWQNVVMGYENLEDYPRNREYLGATVGRVANRIAKGQFEINGKSYQLPINNGPNCNHGGIDGLSFVDFTVRESKDMVTFVYVSEDGEEGFPGTMQVAVKYQLKGPQLNIRFIAYADEDTLCNLTNHSYFNLDGEPSYIGDHILQIHSHQTACLDENGCTIDEYIEEPGGPFDFSSPKPLAQALKSDHPQIQAGNGLDHGFLFDAGENQVVLYSPKTGIELVVDTTYPLAQVYTANWFDHYKDTQGRIMPAQCSVAIECQYIADDIHIHADNPQTLLRKGELFDERISFKFKVR